jgi:hypothetical protein
VHVREPVIVGSLRLLPYVRGSLPGAQPHAEQHAIDAVLAAYADSPGRIVKKATIVELGDFRTGMKVCDIAALFHARHVLAFSALAARRLFHQWHGYCNADAYQLVVQAYDVGSIGAFAFTSRRRDGGTSHVWNSTSFAFYRPAHVHPDAVASLDVSLAEALLRTAPRDSDLHHAIIEFDSANTDSSDIPEHVEVVMTKSAFEFLLAIDEKAQEFVAALDDRVGSLLLEPVDGPLREKWEKRWPNRSLLAAWAHEFCAVRGGAAHGKERRAGRFVWSERAHLAFASVLFPLVMRKVLEDQQVAPMTPYEVARLKLVQSYLVVDPFAPHEVDVSGEHSWNKLENEALMHTMFPSASFGESR